MEVPEAEPRNFGITSGLPVTRSQFARLALEAFLTMLRSDKISRMELKVLFSEDPAFVIRRADKFLSSEPVLHNLILSILHSLVAQGDPGRYWIALHGEKTVGDLTPMGPRDQQTRQSNHDTLPAVLSANRETIQKRDWRRSMAISSNPTSGLQ